MSIREKLYYKVANRFPNLWKLLRICLWGKYDFNNLKQWQSSYKNLPAGQIKQLNNRVQEVVSKALELSSDFDSILEISSGFGNFILKLDDSKKRHATEYSDAAIEYLRSQGIDAQKAILPHLPYDDNAFDVVVAISVFEHLKNAKAIRQSFRECHRVCSEGFIFSVPYNCMQPWDTLIHNYDFLKEDIERFAKGLFVMEYWGIIKVGNYPRSISFLRKVCAA